MPKPTIETVSLETKSFPILTKEIGEERIVESLFAVMGQVDSVNDRIMPGAFKKTIQDMSDRVRVLWQHDFTAPPIGVPLELREIRREEMPEFVMQKYPDATGALLGKVQFLPTPRGEEILTGIRAGAIRENSIGYDPVNGKTEFDKDGVRVLKELRLWDISPVNWGAQAAALTLKMAIDNQRPLLVRALDEFRESLPIEQLEVYEQLAKTIETALMPDALKAGRVLSARNLERLKAALDTLTEILLTAEPEEDDEKRLLALTEQLRRRTVAAQFDHYLIGR